MIICLKIIFYGNFVLFDLISWINRTWWWSRDPGCYMWSYLIPIFIVLLQFHQIPTTNSKFPFVPHHPPNWIWELEIVFPFYFEMSNMRLILSHNFLRQQNRCRYEECKSLVLLKGWGCHHNGYTTEMCEQCFTINLSVNTNNLNACWWRRDRSKIGCLEQGFKVPKVV